MNYSFKIRISSETGFNRGRIVDTVELTEKRFAREFDSELGSFLCVGSGAIQPSETGMISSLSAGGKSGSPETSGCRRIHSGSFDSLKLRSNISINTSAITKIKRPPRCSYAAVIKVEHYRRDPGLSYVDLNSVCRAYPIGCCSANRRQVSPWASLRCHHGTSSHLREIKRT